MKIIVSERGITIPPRFFKGIKEVEIFREKNRILIIPISKRYPVSKYSKSKKNPIMNLAGIVENGHLAENIDEELYGKI